MNRMLSITLSAGMILSSSSSAIAAWPADVPTDLDAWQKIDERDTHEELIEAEDSAFHESSELFPAVGGSSSSSASSDSGFVSVTVSGETITFTDVPKSTWFAPYVREIATQGIVSGYRDVAGKPTGLFGPTDNVTLEQVAKVLTIAAGHVARGCSQASINLTSSGTWSSAYVGCAEKLGLTIYADGTAPMQRAATRAEVIVSLLQVYNAEIEERTGDQFTDVTLSTEFGAFVEQAKRDGIISGYTDANGLPTGLFGPADAVTRAEFAKIVTLGMQVYGSN